MGKSVRKGPSNPYALTPEEINQYNQSDLSTPAPKAATSSAPQQPSNPFALSTDEIEVANQSVKKKDGGTTSGPGVSNGQSSSTENTSKLPDAFDVSKYQTLQSVKEADKPVTRGDKNLLDRDIELNFSVSLSNPNIGGPKNDFSLSSLGNQVNNINANSSLGDLNTPTVRQFEKDQIKVNSNALSDYRKKRLSEIEQQIQDVQNQIAESKILPTPSIGGVAGSSTPISPESTALDAKVQELRQYKSDLSESIRKNAKIAVTREALAASAQSGEPVDLSEVGKRVLQVVGDPTVKDDSETINKIKNPKPEMIDPETGQPIKLPFGMRVDTSGEILEDYDADKANKSIENIQYKRYITGSEAMMDYWDNTLDQLYAKSPEKISQWVRLDADRANATTEQQRNDLTRQIIELQRDPEVSSFAAASNELNGNIQLAKTAMDKFPQVKKANQRQQLNDAFFTLTQIKDNADIGGAMRAARMMFGSTPSKDDLQYLSDATDIPLKQVEEIIGEGGFWKDIPYPVRVQGFLQGVAGGAGDFFTNARMGARRFLDMPNAEALNTLDRDALNEYNIKAQGNKLINDMGEYNFNPYSITNTMGNGVGQIAAQAIPGLLTGGVATEGTIGANLLKYGSAIGPAYISSYEDGYRYAAQNTEDEKTRRAYATVMGLANALPEVILPDADLLKSAVGGKLPAEALFKKFVKQVGEEGLERATAQQLVSMGKQFGKAIGSEVAEEELTNVGEVAAKKGILGVNTSWEDFVKTAQDTFITTILTTLPMGIGAGINGRNDVSNVYKEGLFEAGNRPDHYKLKLEELKDAGDLTQEQYNERVSVVNTMQHIVAKIPKTNIEGKPLSYDEKAALSAQQFRIENNRSKEQSALEAEKPLIEADTNEAISIQTQILNPQLNTVQNENEGQGQIVEEQRSEGVVSIGDQNEGNSTSIPSEGNQEGQLATTEGVAEAETETPSLEDSVAVSEMLDKKGSYQGQRGTFVQDGQTIVFQVDNSNREYEIGNAEQIGQRPISDFEIEQEQSVVSLGDDGSISVRGVSYTNPNVDNPLSAIVRDEDGNVLSVNLQTPEGQRRTFRGQVAQDLAYEMTLQQITNNDESRQQLEDFINTEAVASEIIAEEFNSNPAQEANGNTSQVPQREPIFATTNSLIVTPQTEQDAITESTGPQQKSNQQSSEQQREGIVRSQREQTQEQAAQPGTNDSDSVFSSEATAQEEVSVNEQAPQSSITQAATAEVREEFGLGNEYQKQVITDAELDKEATDAIKAGYNIESLVSRLENGGDPTALETVILKKYLASLEAQVVTNPTDEVLQQLLRLVKATDASGSRLGRAFRLRQGFEVRDDSLAGFFVREQETSGITNLSDMQKDTVKKEYEAIQDALAKYEEKMLKLEEENAKMRASQSVDRQKSSTKRQKKNHQDFVAERKAAVEAAREKLKKLRQNSQATFVPYANELIAIAPDVAKVVTSLVEEGITNLADIVTNIHDQFKDVVPDLTEKDVHNIIAGDYNERKQTRNEIATQVRDLKDQAKMMNRLEALEAGSIPVNPTLARKRSREIEELKAKIKNHPGTKLVDYKNRTLQQISKLEKDLATGNFEIAAPNPKIALDAEALALKDKLIKLRQEREIRLMKQEYEKRAKAEKAKDAILNALNLPRSLMSSLDFSAPLRQAAIVTVAHPITALNAGSEMFKQAFSQQRFDRWFYDVQQSPRFGLMQESGLYVANPHDPRLTVKEEQFMSNLAEKLPLVGKLVKGSERAYTSYLNKMRVDLFNRMADAYESDGFTFDNNPEMFKALASFINNSTGRGNLGMLETAAPVLNSAFFSPRLIASRLNILGIGDLANPGNGYYAKMPSRVRKQALGDLAKFVGAGISVLSLIALAVNGGDDDEEKASVELDPRSSDFGKLKIGKTRWDIWAGFQQYIRIVSEIASGEYKAVNSGNLNDLSGEGKFGKTPAGELIRFVRGKLAPIPSFLADWGTRRTALGEKFELKEAIKNRLLPLTLKDTYEVFREEGVKSLFTQGVPATFGVGVQTYLPRGYEAGDLKNPTYKFLYDRNINLSAPPKGEMSNEVYNKYIEQRKSIMEQEWKQVIEYGAYINEKGHVTINEDAAETIKPADKLTYDELAQGMKSISSKASRQAKKELNIESDE